MSRYFFKVSVTFSAFLFLSALFFLLQFRGRIAPNTYFAEGKISGVRIDQIDSFVDARYQAFESQPLTFVIDGQSFDVSMGELGIRLDREVTVSEIKRLGKRSLISLNFFKRVNLEPEYSVDVRQFYETLNRIFGLHEFPASDATVVAVGGRFSIREAKSGVAVDRSLLTDEIKTRIENLSLEPVDVVTVEVKPQIEADQVQNTLSKVNTLAKQRVVLEFGADKWELSGNKLINILRFYPEGQNEGYIAKFNISGNPIVLKSLSSEPEDKRELEVSVDKESVLKFVTDIAQVLDSETVDATAKFEGDRVTEFTPAVDGQKLDILTTYDLVLSSVSIENLSNEPIIRIKLPVKVTPARIANEQINNLGIRELVGRGVSYFGGSITNRIFNLSLGSKRVSGSIVRPGEVFSFNKAVGEVSGSTGYKPAYVIQKGRTVLDDGGGICQVSTTVFRAALNSGLPVVARTAHAYRVGYYEQGGFKAGLDATVWSPAVDLQFRNDTDNHLLVQAVVDAAAARLQVDIYGTKDGRRVETSEPVVSNIKPAPEPLYQDDPGLPKGTTKQVDFAAQGATSVFTRKVYKGDKLIIDETFKSNFRPWQAVFLVGTGG